MTKLNLDKNTTQQAYRIDSILVVIKNSRLVPSVMTFIRIPVTLSSGYNCSKH